MRDPDFLKLKLQLVRKFDEHTYLVMLDHIPGKPAETPFFVPAAWLAEHGGYYEDVRPAAPPPLTDDERRAAFIQKALTELKLPVPGGPAVPAVMTKSPTASPDMTKLAADLGLRKSSGENVLDQIVKINEAAGPDSAQITVDQARLVVGLINNEAAPAHVRGAAFERISGLPLKDLYRIRPALDESIARRIALMRAAAFGGDRATGLGGNYIPADWQIFIKTPNPAEEYSEFIHALDAEPPASRPATVSPDLERLNRQIEGTVPASEEAVLQRAATFMDRSVVHDGSE